MSPLIACEIALTKLYIHDVSAVKSVNGEIPLIFRYPPLSLLSNLIHPYLPLSDLISVMGWIRVDKGRGTDSTAAGLSILISPYLPLS